VILRGPDDGRDWTLPMLCRWLEARFDKRLHPASLSRIVRRLDLSRQKTRPRHPLSDPQVQVAFAKGGSRVRSRPPLRRIRTSA
jgi:transposase